MNILITGAGGFIGNHLFEFLENKPFVSNLTLIGHNVRKFSYHDKVKVIDGDINKENLMRANKPDIIYHLAGGSSVQASLDNPIEDFERTVLASRILVEVLYKNWSNAKLIFLSSAAVYGKSGCKNTKISLDCLPVSPYGLHKLLVENIFTNYRIEKNLDITILRPFSIYGEGLKKQLLWDALNKARKGDFKFFGTGQELRDWVYIKDLILFLVAYMFNNNLPRVANIGTGDPISVSEVLFELFQTSGYSNVPVFSKGVKEGDPSHLVSDAIEQEYIKKYMKTPLSLGIKNYVDWFEREFK